MYTRSDCVTFCPLLSFFFVTLRAGAQPITASGLHLTTARQESCSAHRTHACQPRCTRDTGPPRSARSGPRLLYWVSGATDRLVVCTLNALVPRLAWRARTADLSGEERPQQRGAA